MSNGEKQDGEPIKPDGDGELIKGRQAGLFGEEMPAEQRAKLIKKTYPFGEVASALQKEIRKGDVRQAVFWGLLLYEVAPWYSWKRTLVCACEDVGLAAPEVVDRVANLALAWRIAREKSWYVTAHHLTMAIVLLCRAPKSTEIEDLQTLTLERIRSGERPPIPEFARDAHTDAGKAAGKTWKDWYADRHGVCGVPINAFTLELWEKKPEWDPRAFCTRYMAGEGRHRVQARCPLAPDVPCAPEAE